MKKITPCIWFDNQGEEAMDYYFSIFKNARLISSSRYGDAGPGKKGQLLVATFELEDMELSLINGGPSYTLNPSFSLSIDCADQQEVDYYWDTLTADGGEESMCGWVKDKYGLSWQVVPVELGKMMSAGDPKKGNAMMQALLKMKKLDIAGLKAAYEAG